jgi:hypothetical protein
MGYGRAKTGDIVMTTRAAATFEITTWEEEMYHELSSGAKLTRASVTQCFSGDIEGVGTVEFLLMYPDSTRAFFAGMQRVVGTLNGRPGSFVLQTNGTYADGKAGADWFVVPGSATGELRGLHGNGGFSPASGTKVAVTLNYNFE